ncbi:hypothetical protein OG21DRAFT_1515081 [Imleria badia]|nr:hypothetical protein OG21DRAFT_1515081 [Imleria badia]
MDRQAPSLWHIRSRENGLFTIKVPKESKGWSLYDTNANANVAVGYIGGTPEQGQLWEIIRQH